MEEPACSTSGIVGAPAPPRRVAPSSEEREPPLTAPNGVFFPSTVVGLAEGVGLIAKAFASCDAKAAAALVEAVRATWPTMSAEEGVERPVVVP